MNQITPVKFADVIEPHSEFFHHPSRTGVFWIGDGDDSIELQRYKSVIQKCFSGFARQTFSPEFGRDRVADFRFARFL